MDKSSLADLHMHTTMSDGFLTPAELILQLKDSGIKTFAVTDHDAVAAVDEMKRRAAFYGLDVVTGVELSAEFNGRDIHFLGYFINHHSKRFLDYLYLFKRRRFQRAQEMLDMLGKLGIEISIEEVKAVSANGPIGRPHIADVMVQKGIVANRNAAFDKYLKDDGPVYVEKYRINAHEVIDLIHSIGGAAFLAHPGVSCSEATIKELCELSLDGIETVHPSHSEEQTKKLTKLAKSLSLLTCGGSDYHGDPESGIELGKYTISLETVREIEEYCIAHRPEWNIDSDEDTEEIVEEE